MVKKGRIDPSRKPQDVVESVLKLSGLVVVTVEGDNESHVTTQLLPRLQMVQELRKLLQMLEDSNLRDTRPSDTSCTFLLQIEQHLQQLREVHLPAARISNQDESCRVLLLKRDLSASYSPSRSDANSTEWSWALVGYSLVATLLHQLSEEGSSILEVGRVLDSVFVEDSPSRSCVVSTVGSAISSLERGALLENPAYLDAVKRLEMEQQNVDVELPALRHYRGSIAATRIRRRAKSHSYRIPVDSCVDGTIQQFLLASAHELCPVTAILVVGDEGSGKSFLCEKAELLAMNKCSVIRPKVPVDFLGRTVGETEARILSMFSVSISRAGKSILILDDVEHLLGKADDERSSAAVRWKRTFLSALDNLRDSVSPDGAVLVLCTSKENSTVLTWRFDLVFYLELPQDDARREVLADVLGIRKQIDDPKGSIGYRSLRDLLDCIVVSTAGRSYAEIMQSCRQALTGVSDAMSPEDFSFSILVSMKDRLTSMTPVSLRDGALDDYVDMRVLSARDLSATDEGFEFLVDEGFPFRGSCAAAAWKELQATIAMPLCRSRELDDLLDHSGSGIKRALAGGILLTGPPCSGKSALALHCAKYAAWMSPSVKLLDVSCTSLIHKELGGSERAVQHLFAAARRASPCIIIMDGLENVAAVRGNDPTTEGTLDRVLSTMLVELDGANDITSSQHCLVAIIGITCNESWIDPAMKRPGRLGKTIHLTSDWE